MIVWCSVALFIISTILNEFFRRIFINNFQVKLKRLGAPKTLEWEDITEYGISKAEKGRDGLQYYYLYFSTDESLPQKNGRRKFSGKTIKYRFEEKHLKSVKDEILPYCEKFARSKANVM